MERPKINEKEAGVGPFLIFLQSRQVGKANKQSIYLDVFLIYRDIQYNLLSNFLFVRFRCKNVKMIMSNRLIGPEPRPEQKLLNQER